MLPFSTDGGLRASATDANPHRRNGERSLIRPGCRCWGEDNLSKCSNRAFRTPSELATASSTKVSGPIEGYFGGGSGDKQTPR